MADKNVFWQFFYCSLLTTYTETGSNIRTTSTAEGLKNDIYKKKDLEHRRIYLTDIWRKFNAGTVLREKANNGQISFAKVLEMWLILRSFLAKSILTEKEKKKLAGICFSSFFDAANIYFFLHNLPFLVAKIQTHSIFND